MTTSAFLRFGGRALFLLVLVVQRERDLELVEEDDEDDDDDDEDVEEVVCDFLGIRGIGIGIDMKDLACLAVVVVIVVVEEEEQQEAEDATPNKAGLLVAAPCQQLPSSRPAEVPGSKEYK
ncbi:MAG: hypothetical protein Q9219_007473 [cf. Caloplaca sp. 3 TL-2023]